MSRVATPVLLVGTIHAAWGDASAGDLRPCGRGDRGEALRTWAATTTGDRGRCVRWLEQLHGSRVVVAGVSSSAGHPLGPAAPVACAGRGDALAATAPDLALTVLTADCAAIALGSPEGVFAAVHAGWRGLLSGVVGRAVGAMRAMGATEVVGAVGPCIHPECYDFSDDDLSAVASVFGEGVRARSSAGRPALDLPAAVAAALAAGGIRQVSGRHACTGCEPGYFSHRARADRGRQALVVWSGDLRTK